MEEDEMVQCTDDTRPMSCINCKYRETIYTNINHGYIDCSIYGRLNYSFNIMDALKMYKPSIY